MGSTGIVASSRATYLAHRDADDLLFLPVKSNLSEPIRGLKYQIRGCEIGKGIHTSVVEWLDETDKSADELMSVPDHEQARTPAVREAEEFLQQALRDGPVKAKELFQHGNEAGITKISLKRAKTILGIESRKRGFGKYSDWQWMTPEQAAIPEYPGDKGDQTTPQHLNVSPFESLSD